MLPNQQHLKKVAALALALGAILPTTATARPVGPDPSGASYTIPQTPVVRITTPASGFDWGDAGIGAAGGLAVAMLGLGGGLVISHQRPRRTRHTTSLPN
jgi:hypothetical protein